MYVNRLKEVFSKQIRTTLIQTLVFSIIYYGMAVWGTTNKTEVKRVQKLQNFCAKVAVGGKSKRDSAFPILEELEQLNVTKKCACEQCIMTNKALTQKHPGRLFSDKISIYLELILTLARGHCLSEAHVFRTPCPHS